MPAAVLGVLLVGIAMGFFAAWFLFHLGYKMATASNGEKERMQWEEDFLRGTAEEGPEAPVSGPAGSGPLSRDS
jgi:hypothetical protein